MCLRSKWPCSRVCSWFLGKSRKCHNVAPTYHFIQKKIITIHAHLTANGLKPSKPTICLLGNRRVKIPLLVTFTKKLRICNWVAVILTKLIPFAVLAFEMKHIHSESYIKEKRVILDSFFKGTVIIKYNMIWLRSAQTVDSLHHLLKIINNKYFEH